MSDPATGAPWWRQELVRFSARARQMLRKNFSSLDRLHDDLISETLVQLTMLLSRQPVATAAPAVPASPDAPAQPAPPDPSDPSDSTDSPDSPDLPAAWFAPEAPSEEDARRFRGLCMTVLNRRVVDHFRTDYKQWALEHPLGDDINEDDGIALQHSPDREAGGALDLVRAARELLTLLAELPDRDRQLMEEVALGGRDGPMDEAERQRIHRLRQRLVDALRARTGQDPVDLLRRL